ncbi:MULTISPECIES: hypothetical protein [unclassified Rhizobium]|uniref:hypothetical protein n=1 Tax=unclassified Rhizobium TaxID=2613769 RepID=UPI000CDF39B5|nr:MULTISPECIES: hypothetical protein [Rhizobium]AVA23105.1 hypothetical protein NXC24_CH03484 [Rhizobium sp. NXC24]MDK4741795.1 hypothetical protein [Rhizobium sp. CNPSo 3464]UWU20465.1 hypothetical protein N2601_14400 [Rhizobium tropici]
MRYPRLLVAAGLAGAFLFADVNVEPGGVIPLSIDFATPAGAIIGRPLTPLSYAGVARRTTRRVVVGTTAGIAVLPAGCVYGAYYGGYYYRCGSGYYAKSGNVYVRVVVQ